MKLLALALTASLLAVGATGGSGQIALDWNDSPPPAVGFNVYRAPVSGGPYSRINGSLLATSALNDTGLAAGTPYFYVVRAENAQQEESANSAEVTSAATGTDTTAPAAPVITSSSRKTRDTTPSTSGTAEPGSTVLLYAGPTEIGQAQAAPNGTWTVANPQALGPDAPYQITARARDVAQNVSDPSTAIQITLDTTPPAAPTNLRTTAYSNCVDVEWDASTSNDVAGYRVERKTLSGSWTLLHSNLLLGTRFRDSTAQNGTTYKYRVTAYDDALEN
jgi:hypothetical protein